MKASVKEVKLFAEFLEKNASKVILPNGSEYYFLPFWFEKKPIDDSFYVHSLGNVPIELREAIGRLRHPDIAIIPHKDEK